MSDLELWSADGMFGVRIPKRILLRLLQMCEVAGSLETGGILIGRYSRAHDCALVTDVSRAPKDSSSGRTWFARGVRGLQVWLDRLWHTIRHYYIGEWHFHPGGSPDPSEDDSRQMHGIARSVLYHCPEPVLLILGGEPKAAWRVGAHVYQQAGGSIELASTSREAVDPQR